MPDVGGRLAALSPERRRLLERLLTPEPAYDAPLEAEQAANVSDFYDSLNRQLDASPFARYATFLNFGYVPDGSPRAAVFDPPAHAFNRNSVLLVLELVGDCPVAGRDLLDVGCGRGGTVETICRYFQPRRAAGIDLSSRAVRFCRASQDPLAWFLQGDAHSLPFADDSFDVVTSVESSHSYPNAHAFFAEVFRVLRHGGNFLYTDVLPAATATAHRGRLHQLGFQCERDRDITANVLRSCDEIAVRRREAYNRGSDAALMREFLGSPDSTIYGEMTRRDSPYFMLRLRKG
jgi:SAM-dependent methyltransferase